MHVLVFEVLVLRKVQDYHVYRCHRHGLFRLQRPQWMETVGTEAERKVHLITMSGKESRPIHIVEVLEDM